MSVDKCIFCGTVCRGSCLFDGGNEKTPRWDTYNGFKPEKETKRKCYVCGKDWVEALDGHMRKDYPNECKECLWKHRRLS